MNSLKSAVSGTTPSAIIKSITDGISNNLWTILRLGGYIGTIYVGGRVVQSMIQFDPLAHPSMREVPIVPIAGESKEAAELAAVAHDAILWAPDIIIDPHLQRIFNELGRMRGVSPVDFVEVVECTNDLMRLYRVLSDREGCKYIKESDGKDAMCYAEKVDFHVTRMINAAHYDLLVRNALEALREQLIHRVDQYSFQIQIQCDKIVPPDLHTAVYTV